ARSRISSRSERGATSRYGISKSKCRKLANLRELFAPPSAADLRADLCFAIKCTGRASRRAISVSVARAYRIPFNSRSIDGRCREIPATLPTASGRRSLLGCSALRRGADRSCRERRPESHLASLHRPDADDFGRSCGRWLLCHGRHGGRPHLECAGSAGAGGVEAALGTRRVPRDYL